jgi:hypothetical protein
MVGIAQPDRRTTETGLSQVQILPARPALFFYKLRELEAYFNKQAYVNFTYF